MTVSTELVSDTDAPAARAPWEDAYAPQAGSFDELIGADGSFRPHWRPFFASMDILGLDELHRRWDEARHLIRENGITYNVYGDPRGLERPWELDPIPLVIEPGDASTLEAGLAQRARLLERLLADLYGDRTLLTSGILPTQLVFGHPGYLRACHGMKLPGGRHLHLYAADVGRAPDGSFLVLRDRTQAPSGAGYALENRIVLSRVLSETFLLCQVHRLAPFFLAVRDSMRAIAPSGGDNPRVVLLTPGPYNETYFEHAFLARYLGYTLVEGGDLTVRDNRVYLKLLGGLQPVDVILRRMDDDYCDPLELRGDSFLGVPGLVQAVRAGNVAVANALGSGLVETPALLAFLPAICQRLLGEDLLLPSVATWWCGEPVGLSHVLANLDRMVVKPTFPATRTPSVFGADLDDAGRAALADSIRAQPGAYVGQEALPLSTTPVLAGDRLQPRHAVFRTYLVANPTGPEYTMMPGGLARFSGSEETLVVSMQKGGGSKDAWVLSREPVPPVSLLPTLVRPVELSRGGGDLPSRAADDLFWLGRYAERTEAVVRLVRAILARLTERTGLVDAPDLPVLLRALTVQTRMVPGFLGPGCEERIAAPVDELLAVLFDGRRAGSLAASVDALRRVAGRVRDRISTDMWRVLVSLDLRQDEIPRGDPRRALSEILDLLDGQVITLAAFSGMAAEGMTRGQGWRFLDIGRRLERALQTLAFVRTTLVNVSGNEGPLLEAMLEVADSAMTYRRRYMSGVAAAPVLDLLIADEENPRSVAFQLVTLTKCLDALPRDESVATVSAEQRVLAAALARLRTASLDRLALEIVDGRRAALGSLLTAFESELPMVSDIVTQQYLSHLRAARQYAIRAT
jgi:uncharacterized circularly permuted ATP-grasp superfamily protein/uncharacterized alpha-E superfamily protein